MKPVSKTLLFLLLGVTALNCSSQTRPLYKYFRTGSPSDVSTKTTPGFALMGGGHDLDDAFRWMCTRSGGGDFLILRAAGDDAYNAYVQGLCHQNSIATLIMPTRESASPGAAALISKAEAIFIAGGDQSDYINFWKGTPVQQAINDAIHRGVPLGGTSAGLAVMGEYIYSAQNDEPDGPELNSTVSLADPFHRQIIVVQGFLDNSLLTNTITDTHFVARNRLGRLLTMMARILESQPIKYVRGIGVDERTSVLLESNGRATVVGAGAVYFLQATKRASAMIKGKPLTFGPVSAVKLTAGQTFDIPAWKGTTVPYNYTIDAGVVHSSAGQTALY